MGLTAGERVDEVQSLTRSCKEPALAVILGGVGGEWHIDEMQPFPNAVLMNRRLQGDLGSKTALTVLKA